jgi:hypothetical protein
MAAEVAETGTESDGIGPYEFWGAKYVDRGDKRAVPKSNLRDKFVIDVTGALTPAGKVALATRPPELWTALLRDPGEDYENIEQMLPIDGFEDGSVQATLRSVEPAEAEIAAKEYPKGAKSEDDAKEVRGTITGHAQIHQLVKQGNKLLACVYMDWD